MARQTRAQRPSGLLPETAEHGLAIGRRCIEKTELASFLVHSDALASTAPRQGLHFNCERQTDGTIHVLRQPHHRPHKHQAGL